MGFRCAHILHFTHITPHGMHAHVISVGYVKNQTLLDTERCSTHTTTYNVVFDRLHKGFVFCYPQFLIWFLGGDIYFA